MSKNNVLNTSQAILSARMDSGLGRSRSAINRNDLLITRFATYAPDHPAIAMAKREKLLLTLERPGKNRDEYLAEIDKLIQSANDAYQNSSLVIHPDRIAIQPLPGLSSFATERIQAAARGHSNRLERFD